jgi:hypothetical protein
VLHPATGEAAVPRIPGERFLPAESDGRLALAEWLTATDERRLATAQVNRLWQAMFGRGLIEPVDDLRDTNPATHPELLARLADDFVASGYRLRHTLRLLALSAAYQRSSQPLAAAANDDRFYSHAVVRPLPPEVLLDAVSDVFGTALEFGEVPPGTRAIGLYSPHLATGALGPLAGCGQSGQCPAGPAATASMDQLAVQLHWINGPLAQRAAGESVECSSRGSRPKPTRRTRVPRSTPFTYEFFRAGPPRRSGSSGRRS